MKDGREPSQRRESSEVKRVPRVVGRGAQLRPPNRFDILQTVSEVGEPERITTQYHPDMSQSIVSENQSPDVGFRYSVNAYRGCVHGCSYCYARPTHEYLGFDAGLDFESQIMVKHEAPRLLRKWLSRKQWQCEPIAFSGVTDCYQPAEKEFHLTRGCLEVAYEARQPVLVITKNALVARDVDLLASMAKRNLVEVGMSITSLSGDVIKRMEPRTSSPAARLRAMQTLASAGVPVKVMVAPIVPALNDHEIPQILRAAADHGATGAGYVMLRLPHAVRPIFLDWLQKNFPNRAAAVVDRIRSVRSGHVTDSEFGRRMRGSGIFAEQIAATFKLFARRAKLATTWPQLNCDDFRPPNDGAYQRRLF